LEVQSADQRSQELPTSGEGWSLRCGPLGGVHIPADFENFSQLWDVLARSVGLSRQDDHVSLVKSKQRVADHGEVFTPDELVEAMIGLVQDEVDRIDSRFLEPACGSGNFLVPVLIQKLATVEAQYGRSEFERRHYGLLALMSLYGIELLQDNVQLCRENLTKTVDDFIGPQAGPEWHEAARRVTSTNVVQGDALTMRVIDENKEPITFAEWTYLGKGRFHRRDFRFDTLTQMSTFGEDDTLFADMGKHEIFTPVTDHGSLSVSDLAGVSDE
jgi:hypothetical protein